MANYTFDLQGHELRVTDGTDHTIILQMRDDGLGVNIKDDTTFHQYPEEVRKALDQLGETRGEGVYNGVVADFWSWAEECAQRHGFDEVYQDGRSGGWLVLPGTGELDADQLLYPKEEDRDLRERALAAFFEIERSVEEDWRPQFFEQVKTEAAERPDPSQMENSTPYKETFTEAAELLNVAQAVGSYDAEILPTYGVEADPADDPETAREEAGDSAREMVTEITATATLTLSLDGPDERRLVFECEVGAEPSEFGPLGGQLTITRVLYGFGDAQNAELTNSDRDLAVQLGGMSLSAINDAKCAWEGDSK